MLFALGQIVVPLVIWLAKKDESPFIADHARESLNFQISMTLYFVISGALTYILVGFLFIGILAVHHIGGVVAIRIVRRIAFGLGACSFGEPVAALIDYHYAPLLEGRDALAIEFLNDLMWRSSMHFGPGGVAAAARSGVDNLH